MVKEAPTDNSAPLEVEIWTDDYHTATPHDLPFASQYQFGVQATFTDWPGLEMNYWDVSGGEQEMKFAVRDYCLGSEFTDALLTVRNPTYLYTELYDVTD